MLLGDYESAVGRNNLNGIDLNRNFPGRYPQFADQRLQPEVMAVMAWIRSYPFVLSANLHGGSLVANYPFDDTSSGRSALSLTPDDTVFRKLAYSYSRVTNHASPSL